MALAEYKFQFETGALLEGSIEIEIRDFRAMIEEPLTPGLELMIMAHGGKKLVIEPEPKPKTQKRKVNSVKWKSKQRKEVKNDSSDT